MRNKVKNYKCAAKNNKAIANNKQVCDIKLLLQDLHLQK